MIRSRVQCGMGWGTHRATLGLRCGIFALVAAEMGCRRDARPRVDLQITHYSHVSDTATAHHPSRSISIVGADGSIALTGTVAQPEGCDAVDAKIEEDAPTLVVALRARRTSGHGGPCDPSDRWVIIEYTGRISNLKAANQPVSVVYDRHVHHAPNEGGQGRSMTRETLYEGEVTVR